jgi:hypothetical protein
MRRGTTFIARLFNATVAGSLLLCVVAAAIWVRSFYSYDGLIYDSNWRASHVQKRVGIISYRGTLSLLFDLTFEDASDTPLSGPAGVSRYSFPATDEASAAEFVSGAAEGGWLWMGFGYYPIMEPDTLGRTWLESFTKFQLYVPCWFAVIAFAAPPAWWYAMRRRRDGRARSGRCRCCGYDLRATPDRCPECGAVPHEPPHNPPMQRTATAESGAVK